MAEKDVYVKVRCRCGEFVDLLTDVCVSTLAGESKDVRITFEQTETQYDDFSAHHQQQFTCKKCGTRIGIGAEGENMFRPIKFLTLNYYDAK